MEQNVKGRGQRTRKRMSVFTGCSLLFTLCFLIYACNCFAASAHEEYKKIQKEIRKQKSKIEEIKKYETSVINDIDSINKQLKVTETSLKKYKGRLSDTESNISRVEADITINKKNIERHREWMKRKLHTIYKYGKNADVFLLLISSDDIGQLMRRSKYLQYLTVHEHKMLTSYKENLQSLNKKQTQLVALKKDLQNTKQKIQSEEETLAETMKRKEKVLGSVKQQKTSHMRILKDLKDASNRILDIIRESEKAEKDKGDIYAGKGFGKQKGNLPWPVEGKIVVPYGSQKDPEFNTPIFRSGAYIQAGADSSATAVSGGRVVFAEWFKGYGKMVIINHGDGYHTLYASLSEIFTKVGDIIKRKQAIGRVGSSGIMTSPGLYFELRYKGKPLDPLQWLQRR
jgi:murein hydrolase activator